VQIQEVMMMEWMNKKPVSLIFTLHNITVTARKANKEAKMRQQVQFICERGGFEGSEIASVRN
jgi:hypothetical protein